MYIYSVEAQVDIITLFNHLGFLVSYDVLQKKLKELTISTITWIKSQASNRKLVGFWDNFKFSENVCKEKTENKVKF